MEQNGRKAVRYLYFAGNLVVRVVGSAIFLLLAWYSFWYTQYMLPGGRELPVDVRDSGSRNLMGLAVAAGIMAGLLLCVIPILILYIALQKQIINGVVTGAVK